MSRNHPPERVEMITGDPGAFGAPAVPEPSPPASRSSRSSRSRVGLALGGVAAVVLAVALVWPRSPHHPLAIAVTTTASTVPSVSTVPLSTTPPGRDAPDPVIGAHIGLSVTPSTAVLRQPVTVRLSGDLTTVSPTMAAVVWVDRETAPGQFRTVAWIAQVGSGRQLENAVTEDGLSPGPDAIFLPPAQPFDVSVDALDVGTYRLCRYVPVHTTDASTVPATTDTIYVCSELTIDRA